MAGWEDLSTQRASEGKRDVDGTGRDRGEEETDRGG